MMYPSNQLSIPRVEIDFDTPQRDRFLRDQYSTGQHRSSYTVLGRGSYGVVIKARYRGKPVAVKIVEKNRRHHRSKIDSLRNEGNVLKLRHENIVRVLKIISGAQYGLVIMERFDGHCLQSVLNENYEIGTHHRLLILCDIINGLCFCHRHRIVHLDVKPQNVIICLLVPEAPSSMVGIPTGSPRVRNYLCKLCDFGCSQLLDAKRGNNLQNINNNNKGTIRYMAPELLRGVGPIAEAADVYSFGVTMWQLAELKDPYDSITSNEAVAYNVVKKRLRPDSVTTAEILRSEPVEVPSRKNSLLGVGCFRTRKRSDNSLEVGERKTNGHCYLSYHSSILMSSNASNGPNPAVDFTTEVMDEVLQEPGLDLVEHQVVPDSDGVDELMVDSENGALSLEKLNKLFTDTISGIDPTDQNFIRQEYRNLYSKCWQHEASARPVASDVRSSLHSMLKRIVCCK
ncbi:death-associated protein kinase 3 [Uranotaenia lowii]|uniref:death-associated protein kinase 3 n=1 Tax=Uranotaenia lowii TaxID=190385 RepID=UPI002479CD38|nr:death-associated protein kinase 3 [Uranotaenia lowii]